MTTQASAGFASCGLIEYGIVTAKEAHMLKISFGEDHVAVSVVDDDGVELQVTRENCDVEVMFRHQNRLWNQLNMPMLKAIRLAANFNAMMRLYSGGTEPGGEKTDGV